MIAKLVTMIATVLQKFLVCSIVLILFQKANSKKHNDYDAQSVRNSKENPLKDLLFHEDKTNNATIHVTSLRIKRQTDKNRDNPRPVPLPILVGGRRIGGFGREIGQRGIGARGPSSRGFGPRSVGARGLGAIGLGGRGIGGLGRGIGGFGGRGRG